MSSGEYGSYSIEYWSAIRIRSSGIPRLRISPGRFSPPARSGFRSVCRYRNASSCVSANRANACSA